MTDTSIAQTETVSNPSDSSTGGNH